MGWLDPFIVFSLRPVCLWRDRSDRGSASVLDTSVVQSQNPTSASTCSHVHHGFSGNCPPNDKLELCVTTHCEWGFQLETAIPCTCYSPWLQNSIWEWVRDHRLHHKYSETDADPHNSRRGFFFSHMGWLLVRKHPMVRQKSKIIDLSDLEADKIVMFQKRWEEGPSPEAPQGFSAAGLTSYWGSK